MLAHLFILLCTSVTLVAAHTVELGVCQDASDPTQYLLLLFTYHSCNENPGEIITFEETINGVPQGDRTSTVREDACTTNLATLDATVCESGTAQLVAGSSCNYTGSVGVTGILPFKPTSTCGDSYAIQLKATNGAVYAPNCAFSPTAVDSCIAVVSSSAGITVELDTQPDNGADVQFTHNIQPQGAFTLDDDTDATHANNVTLTPAKPGQYRVTLQGLPVNHRLEAIECDSDDVTVQLDQRRVLVDHNDTDISCTFVLVGLGSCCSKHADDGCVKNISEEECLDIDRQASWTLGGDCGQNECPRGACCLQFGHCEDRSSPDVCAAKGGSFNGLATKCDSKTCGACCGGNTVDGCADDIARSQCSSTATHVGGQRCAQSCGACCEDSTCTPRAQTSLNGKPCASFILGDYKCSKQCGSCCGGANCKDNQFESQCGFDGLFSNGTCADTCGACCDNGTCQVTIGEDGCSEGVFQGEGSNCGGDTCPLGNVCCQNDEDQPCLTGINVVEECTGAGQFAAEKIGRAHV